MFSLLLVWRRCWTNSRLVGYFGHHDAHLTSDWWDLAICSAFHAVSQCHGLYHFPPFCQSVHPVVRLQILQKSSFTNPGMHLFHIPQCSTQKRNVHISVLFWMEHCGIWNRRILGFVKMVICVVNGFHWCGNEHSIISLQLCSITVPVVISLSAHPLPNFVDPISWQDFNRL